MLRALRRSFATAPTKVQHPLLSLASRVSGGDHEQLARLRCSTQAAFSLLVHQHEAKDASWVKLLESSEPVRAVVAERVLEVCIAQRQPRCLVHVLTRLEPGVQFSASTSKEALRMVRQTGNSTDLRQLLRLLQPSPEANLKALSSPPLKLSLEDLNDTVSLCLQRAELNEAVRWYIAIRDVFGLVPTEATFALILPSLANSKSWEALFAVLGEMRLQNVQISMRTYDIILQEVQKRPTLRWMYAQAVLLRLGQVRAHEGDRDALLLKSARRTMSVLSNMKKYGAVVDTWEKFSKELTPEQSRSILNDKQVLQFVGSSVVKARCMGNQEKNLELLMKRILIENDGATVSSSLEGLVESRIRNCNNASDNNANDGVFVGLGLSWLLQSKDGRGKSLDLYEQLDFGARANSSSLRADVLQTVTMSLADADDFGLQEAAQLLRSALFSDKLPDKRFEMSEELALGIIPTLGRTQDADAIAHLLLLCAQRNVNLTEFVFTIASQTFLQKRDYRLVVQLLESYLAQLDATLVGKRGRQLASCSNPNVFSPALEALAQLGELDLMLTLLLTEMRERRCAPSRALFVVAISACGNAGRFEEGVRLFDLARKDFAALPKNSSHDEMRALVTAALTCCARGRLGTKALSLFAWIDDKLPGLYSGKVNEELRVLQLVVEAMDSPESAPMLPSFLGIVKSRGHRSLQVTRQLLVSCLAVAISSASEALVAALLTQETAGDAELEDLRQEAEKLLKSTALHPRG